MTHPLKKEDTGDEEEEGLQPVSSIDLDEVHFSQHERCYTHTILLTIKDCFQSVYNLMKAVSKDINIVSH